MQNTTWKNMLRILQSRQLFGVKKKHLKEVLIAYDIEGKSSSFSIDLVISYKYIFFQIYLCLHTYSRDE